MLTADDFDQLYRQYQERVFCAALRRLNNNRWDAADAAAATWAQALEQRAEWTPRSNPTPLPWLLTLLRYNCLAIIRRGIQHPEVALDAGADAYELQPYFRRTDAPPADAEDEEPYPGLADPATHEAWRKVWPTMAEGEATAVWCLHVGGFAPWETADLLGVTKQTARQLAGLGLKKIERFFHGDWKQTGACKRCGHRPLALGHRIACLTCSHDKTSENTYVHPNGRTECRSCRHDRDAAKWQRRKLRKQAQRNMNSNDRWPIAATENGVNQ